MMMKNVVFLLENEIRGSFLSIMEETEKLNQFLKDLRKSGLNVIKVAVSSRLIHALYEGVPERSIVLFDEMQCTPKNTLLIVDRSEAASYYSQKGYAVIGYERQNMGPCKEVGITPNPRSRENNNGFWGIRYLLQGFDDIDEIYLKQVFQRLHNIPWTICETKRCIVREITVEDVERLYEIYADDSVTAYMEDLFANPEEEKEYTRQYIKNIYHMYGYGMWIVEDKKSGQVIGRAGLEQNEGMEGLELGYVIAVTHQRQGYAYEVCDAIIKYAWENLEAEVITSAIQEGNVASEKLCQKLGFMKVEKFIKNEITYLKYKKCR